MKVPYFGPPCFVCDIGIRHRMLPSMCRVIFEVCRFLVSQIRVPYKSYSSRLNKTELLQAEANLLFLP